MTIMTITNDLMNFRSIVERRKVLKRNMTEIKGHIMFSEVKELHVSYIPNILSVIKCSIIF